MDSVLQNRTAYLDEPGAPLVVRDAPFPEPGPGEIEVRNAAIAINPVDWHMTDSGILLSTGLLWSAATGRPQFGAFQLYIVVSIYKAAQLPLSIPFTEDIVLPLALETVIHLYPVLTFSYPFLKDAVKYSAGKTIVVYGGSSSVSSVTTQLAETSGLHVITIVGARNSGMSKESGAAECFDHKDSPLVKLVEAVRDLGGELVGIVEAISIPETITIDLKILENLGRDHLALNRPHMGENMVPDNVEIGMVRSGGVNEITDSVWRTYVGAALKFGKLKCLPPPTIVGKGLEVIQKTPGLLEQDVSATKLVVEFEQSS
ncbi:uncharacterized protein M421DRAFT_390668 [Didymella exigua CBS 183.55]|uniref:GroES-like protein n=1 Tax=Didymella exigua CBS 183.55 TaxID=1150837 RepID=A0A6A5RN31_9PLEO|nr:uncharacterized protein M421DRAFT_390668 [Didymella exigua CBS 183.55]KAF1928843.1 hypothetical protein M421DRAFT_390668 [Didymella exigua CBS 183.55]